ncbi:MAG: PspC domain-containing protein [Thermaurantimonas sp.]
MKKTISIALGGMPFIFTEEAYSKLKKYLCDVKNLLEPEYREETLRDIELRCAELLLQRVSAGQVIEADNIHEIMVILGDPSVFAEEDSERTSDSAPLQTQKKKLFRDPDQKILGGVASGISHFFGVNPLLFRILFVFLTVFSGLGIPAYLILWIVIPKAQSSVEKLMMKGEKIHFKKIQETIRKELESTHHNPSGNNQLPLLRWIDQFIDFLRNLLSYAIRFLQRFTKALLMVMIGILIFFLFTFIWFYSVAIFSGSFYINGVEITRKYLSDLILLFFGSKEVFFLLILITAVGISSLVILLILSLRRIGASPNKNNLKAIVVSAFVTILSGSFLVACTLYLVSQYRGENTNVILSKTLVYNEGDTLYLVPLEYNADRKLTLLIEEDMVYSDNLELRVEKASDNTINIFSKIIAYGPDKNTAFKNSQNVRFNISIEHDRILIPTNISFPLKDGYRRQKAYVDLYLPEKCIIYIPNEFLSHFMDKISLTNDYWVAGYYTMTERGLKKL